MAGPMSQTSSQKIFFGTKTKRYRPSEPCNRAHSQLHLACGLLEIHTYMLTVDAVHEEAKDEQKEKEEQNAAEPYKL